MKHPVLILLPTAWDARQLEACREAWQDRFEVHFGELDDHDCPSNLDVEAYLDTLEGRWRGRLAGVFSSSDYPGATLAALLAQRLGLPGAPPAAVLRTGHKYYARVAQRECVPDATPPFHLLPRGQAAPDDPVTGYPCFVKPIKGAFSIMSGKVTSPKELDAFLDHPATREFLDDYVGIFNRLVRRYTDLEVDASAFLLEGFLHGDQVTVEGWVQAGEAGLLGVVDSVMHPEVPSFARFDYPTTLRPEVAERAWDVALRAVRHMGLDHTLFNVEMIYEPAGDTLAIIEINPRLCGQFGDLYQKVDGVSGYVAALHVAVGEPPPRGAPGSGRYSQASSVPQRTFQPVRVAAAPAPESVAAAEGLHPGTLVWAECVTGQELSDFAWEDGRSARYGVVNVGGTDRWDLRRRLDEVVDRLGYQLTPLHRPPSRLL